MSVQPDIIWNEQCLGIRIGEQVCTYLKKHDAEYQRLQKKILEFTEKYPVIETFMESNQSISLTEEEHKALHRYFQLESEKEMIEEQYHFYMGQAQMISYGAMLGKIKKAILGKDDGDTQKLLELLMDTWIDDVEEQLKENTVYQEMLEKISKYEEQVQTMGLSKEKRKTIDAYVTEVSERWILYAESLYQAGMQKILEGRIGCKSETKQKRKEKYMEQAKIEQLAFLYLCSEHDKRLLLKKEKMQLADFDRLTYLIYYLGLKEYHIKIWMEFAGDFKKEWDCLEALRETGGCVGNMGNTESENRLHELWIQEFYEKAPKEIRVCIKDLD